MRLPRPLIALLLTASCTLGAPTAAPVPVPDAQAPLQQYADQPTRAAAATATSARSAEAAAMQRRAGKKWPWIVAGVVVVGVVVVLIASGGGYGSSGY